MSRTRSYSNDTPQWLTNSLYAAIGLCVVAIIALAAYSWHLDPENFVKNMQRSAAYYTSNVR